MSLDRDLRDALQPLAGDPVAVAARVLRALPEGPPGGGPGGRGGPKGVPPIGWWLLGAGLGVGLLGGLVAGGFFGRITAPDQPAAPPATAEAPKEVPPLETEKKDDPKPAEKPTTPQPPMGMPDMLLMAFGPVDVDEPDVGFQKLYPGRYELREGSSFTTNASLAGLYVWATDARIRLDRETVAKVNGGAIALTRGRAWVSSGSRRASVSVDAGIATVLAEDGTFTVDRRDGALEVLAIGGSVTVRTARSETVRLAAAQRVRIDPDRGAGTVETLPFLGTATSWMVPMILLEQDDTELRQRVDAMVTAYEKGVHRDAAIVELRRLGDHAVTRLYKALDIAPDPASAKATAELLGDLASFAQREWLLAGLALPDPDVRATLYRALVRITGTTVRDETFWRDGSQDARLQTIEEWRAKIR